MKLGLSGLLCEENKLEGYNCNSVLGERDSAAAFNYKDKGKGSKSHIYRPLTPMTNKIAAKFTHTDFAKKKIQEAESYKQ